MNDFLQSVSKHQMHIIIDEGQNRHILFKNPDEMHLYFALTSWKHHLCISGDMGTYVFKRYHSDMFQFFYTTRINEDYWTGKLVADSQYRSYKQYSSRVFREVSEEIFLDAYGEDYENEAEWRDYKSMVLRNSYCENEAEYALSEYKSIAKGICLEEFYASDCWEYTEQYIWCLNAIRWGVEQYRERTK